MNKQISLLYAVLIVIIVGGLAFYGGVTYAHSSGQRTGMGGQQANGQARGTFGQGQQGAGAQGGATGARAGARGGAVIGEVLSKDANSMTIKLASGGSQIVLLSNTTTVSKMSVGSLSDVAVGTSVVVMGSTNADGSVTAQSLQIRPVGAPAMQGGQGPQAGAGARGATGASTQ